jgi:2-C-methyl-D-erythritol 2,4-cyclodiphosphate synthase
MRIGTGYDVHAFCEGDFLTLGGIEIPFNKAFAAHSDGDVLIHAICDALLGALALGDIGQHFPPSDNKWKGCDSSVFLKHIIGLVDEQGYQISNIDSTVICEQPKMQPHITTMRKNLSKMMKIDIKQVSVKATTTEKLGYCGRSEGVAVQSVWLLSLKS